MDWTSLILQVPVVAAFVWYARETQKGQEKQNEAFLAALADRDKTYQERNGAIVEALNANTAQLMELTKMLCSHDATTREYINSQHQARPRSKTQ